MVQLRIRGPRGPEIAKIRVFAMMFLSFLDVLWGKVAPRRLISCENTYFLEVFADGTAKIPHFLGFEDPVGSIL